MAHEYGHQLVYYDACGDELRRKVREQTTPYREIMQRVLPYVNASSHSPSPSPSLRAAGCGPGDSTLLAIALARRCDEPSPSGGGTRRDSLPPECRQMPTDRTGAILDGPLKKHVRALEYKIIEATKAKEGDTKVRDSIRFQIPEMLDTALQQKFGRRRAAAMGGGGPCTVGMHGGGEGMCGWQCGGDATTTARRRRAKSHAWEDPTATKRWRRCDKMTSDGCA